MPGIMIVYWVIENNIVCLRSILFGSMIMIASRVIENNLGIF